MLLAGMAKKILKFFKKNVTKVFNVGKNVLYKECKSKQRV
jgi:hypothetical protein